MNKNLDVIGSFNSNGLCLWLLKDYTVSIHLFLYVWCLANLYITNMFVSSFLGRKQSQGQAPWLTSIR